MECTYCGEELDEYELEEPYKDPDGDIMCDNCYTQDYLQECNICEEYYDKPENAEETFFVMNESSKVQGMEPGVYKVLKWPYYSGSIIGSLYITKYNVERVADYNEEDEGEICSCCYKELTRDILNKKNYEI